MIKIKKDKLIIIIEHPYPKELLIDIRLAIVNVLQAQFVNRADGVIDELTTANYNLLEFLKQLMEKNEPPF